MLTQSGYSGRPVAGVVAVIPAYNEERFIGSVVLLTRKFVDAVVVVDDGSRDRTAEVAEDAGAYVLRHTFNQGKSAAMNTALTQLRQQPVQAAVFIDGDGQHYPEDIPMITQPILEGQADVVVGSRFLQRKSHIPAWRTLGQRSLTLATNTLSGLPLTDSQSGFRAFSRAALQRMRFNPRGGFTVESEMQFLAQELELKIVEVPIGVIYAEGSKRNPVKHGLQILNGLLRLVGQSRPLLFFGGLGTALLLAGLAFGWRTTILFEQKHLLAVGHAVITLLLGITGALSLFTAITLHSARGLFRHFVNGSAREPDKPSVRGLLRLVGQGLPPLFFGGLGTTLLLAGLAFGWRTTVLFEQRHELAAGHALITLLLGITGALSLFTGITLHSVRSLFLHFFHRGAPKPDKPPVSGLLRLVGQTLPPLFFGGLGTALLLAGLALGWRTTILFEQKHVLAVGHAVITLLLGITGALSLFTGITLHSVRNLFLHFFHPGAPKPDRPPVSGLLRLVGQGLPLLFLGGLGTALSLAGLAFGWRTTVLFEQRHVLAVGHALITLLLCTTGTLSLFTGLTLHSVRSLFLHFFHPAAPDPAETPAAARSREVARSSREPAGPPANEPAAATRGGLLPG